MGIRRKLFLCAATVALTASGSLAAATPSGIYLSTWGTAHVTFGDGFRAWLKQAGAVVSADAPVTLDADGGGFTLPAAASDRLDTQGRMVYQGDVEVTVADASAATRTVTVLALGPLHVSVLPDLIWTAGLSVNGKPMRGNATGGELRLATGDYTEVLAGGGSPSPTGYRAAGVPFHLAQETADLLARASGRTGPAAGALFGTLVPRFDQVPTRG